MLPWMKKPRLDEAPAAPALPSVPPGGRLYAVGDIHGRADLLLQLMEMIRADMQQGEPGHRVVVFLGDYIDRGPDTRKVLDILSSNPFPESENVFLIGNHEAVLLQFLRDPAIGKDWVRFGGAQTLAAYGAVLPSGAPSPAQLNQARDILRTKLPPQHLSFVRSLKLTYRVGDYLFVHAGIRPGLPLDQQASHDLLWIRKPFLESELDHGHVVVHGHTPSERIESLPNRIGIDTGAYRSDRLSAVVLEADLRRFLAT